MGIQQRKYGLSQVRHTYHSFRFLFEHLFLFQSGKDLVIRNKEAQKLAAPVVARGLKKKHPDGSAESKQAISNLQGLCYNDGITTALIP